MVKEKERGKKEYPYGSWESSRACDVILQTKRRLGSPSEWPRHF